VNSVELISRHAIDTLPDSIMARRELLSAIRGSLPLNNETRLRAHQMLYHLDAHEKLQRTLPLAFNQGGVK